MTELMELFLSGPAPLLNHENSLQTFSNFATEFIKFVDKNSMLKPAIHNQYFTMFFVSSLLTLPYSNLLDRNLIPHVHFKIDEFNVIKLVYPRIVDQTLVMEFRSILIGSNVMVNSQPKSGGKHGFTMEEVREIVDVYRLDEETLQGLKCHFKIFQISKNFNVFWTEVTSEFIRHNLNLAIKSKGTSWTEGTLRTFTQLSNVQDDSESLLLDPFTLLSSARTPEQMKDISIHLMENLRLLYSMNAHLIPKQFPRTFELFSAFACGTIAMNVQGRYQQTVFIHQPTSYMHLISLIPQMEKTMNLYTPISLAFVDSKEHFTATMELVNSPDHNMMWSSPLTNSKFLVFALSNFNRQYDDDSIASALLDINKPLMPKLINNFDYMLKDLVQENLESFLVSDVNKIFNHLGSRDFTIVSNYLLGQVLALQSSDAINDRYLFTYADQVLRDNVRTCIFITAKFAFALSILRNKDEFSKTVSFWNSNHRRLTPKNENGKFVVTSDVWKRRMIHLNIDVKTGTTRLLKWGEGPINNHIGFMKKMDRFTPKSFILSAGHFTANRDFAQYIAPLREYFTTSSEVVAFFIGLFAEEYSCLPSTSSEGKQMLFLFNLDSNTVLDAQKIASELKKYHTESSTIGQPSLIQDMKIRINIFSSVYNTELLVRIPEPAMSVDLILSTASHDSSVHDVELRKTFHSDQSLENLLSPESATDWSLDLPDDCLLPVNRLKRSWMKRCRLAGENLDKKLLDANNENEKPVKYLGLLTENQVSLFQHVISDYQYQLWNFVDRTRLLQNLHNIQLVSNAVTLGIIYKNIAADIYRGDYAGAISGAAFLGGNHVVSKTFTFLSERKYLHNSKTLGFLSPVLKKSAPFLRRFAAGYNLYSLYKSASSFSKNQDTMSLVNVIESSTFLAVDVAEISMELAGMEALLSVFGPAGAAVTALVFVAAEIYQVHEQLKPYDEMLHLSLADKVVDGAYTFFTGEVDAAVKDMANEKQLNENLATLASMYLSNHTELLAYIFPIYISVNGKKLLADNNVIKLDQKRNIQWSSALPNVRKLRPGTRILCFTSTGTEWSNHAKNANTFEKFKHHWILFWESAMNIFKTKQISYQCDNALGLLNKNVSTGKILIDLQDGDDIVSGFTKYEHIYIIGNGHKAIHSTSDDASTFMFTGNLTTGSITNSGKGTADLSGYAKNLPGFMYMKMHGRKTVVKNQGNRGIHFENVSSVIARKNQPDHMLASCYLSLYNGNGGSKLDFDILSIPDQLCFYNMTVFGSDSMRIDNQATMGSFKYFWTLNIGHALLNMSNSSLVEHEVFFRNWNMTDLDRLFSERQCLIFVYWTAYAEICGENLVKTTFRFMDGFNLKIGRERRAYGTVNSMSDSEIETFYRVSQRLGVLINIRILGTNSSLLISHNSNIKSKHMPVVLHNDPANKHSILIGGAMENVFVISPNVNSNFTNITISVLNNSSFHNTIDLTSFVQDGILLDIRRDSEDLVINLKIAQSTSTRATLKIKRCFENDLYQTFTIVFNNPMLIELRNKDSIHLIPRPLTIEPSENPATIIVRNQIEPSLHIFVNQTVRAWSIFHVNQDLVWFAHGLEVEFFWLIFKDFYTITLESLIDIRIVFTDNKVNLLWNNTRQEIIPTLESIMEFV